ELSFAAARYHVQRVGGALPITVYSLAPRPNTAALTARLAEVVAVLVREFGPLPQGEFALVEAPADRAGAAGFDGASLDGMILATESYLDGPFNMGFFAHEVGHQWWGVSVRHRGEEGNYLLDEAMAQYGALQVVEALEGPAAARSFRLLGYPGVSFTHGLRGYAYLARAGYDYPLAALPDTGYLAQVSHDLADGKGFLVHDLVARTVGRERFRAAQQRFLREHAGGEVTFAEWKAAIERAAGRPLDALWRQWYGRPGLPRFRVEWRQSAGALEGTIRQEAPFYQATVPLLVRFDEGSFTRRVAVEGGVTRFRFAVPSAVRAVELDPDALVPRWTDALLAEASANAGGMRAYVDAQFRQDPDAARAELERMLREVPQPDLYGTRFGAHYLLGTLAFFANDTATARQQFALALASPTRLADSLPWLYVRLAHIAQREGDEAGMRRALADALSADAAGERPSGVAAYIARSFPPAHRAAPP
ncbi:MAG TPA: M1 family aminopeptidase, partial [Longimicrobiaceae bacterium]|nr:M1 family aminopeptidase [Longimicrobiaceae bacterium]